MKRFITYIVFIGLLLGMFFPSTESFVKMFSDTDDIALDISADDLNETPDEEDSETEKEEQKDNTKEIKEYLAADITSISFLNSKLLYCSMYNNGFSDHYIEIVSPPPQI